jgi:hypothetical protein
LQVDEIDELINLWVDKILGVIKGIKFDFIYMLWGQVHNRVDKNAG